MTDPHRIGTMTAPIELLDSDDESDPLPTVEIYDLTQDDSPILLPAHSLKHPPAIMAKASPKSAPLPHRVARRSRPQVGRRQDLGQGQMSSVRSTSGHFIAEHDTTTVKSSEVLQKEASILSEKISTGLFGTYEMPIGAGPVVDTFSYAPKSESSTMRNDANYSTTVLSPSLKIEIADVDQADAEPEADGNATAKQNPADTERPIRLRRNVFSTYNLKVLSGIATRLPRESPVVGNAEVEVSMRARSFFGDLDVNSLGTLQPLALLKETPTELLDADESPRPACRKRKRVHEVDDGQTCNTIPPVIHTNAKKNVRETSPREAIAEAQRNFLGLSNTDRTRPSMSLSTMEHILSGIKNEMGENHALFVKSQLLKSRTRNNHFQGSMSDYYCDISPFAAMMPLQKGGKSPCPVSGCIIRSTEERVPRYKHYTTVKRSFLVDDTRQLPSLPYLEGECSSAWLEEVRNAFDEVKDPQASRKAERASQLNKYLPKMLGRLDLDKKGIVSSIVEDNPIDLDASQDLTTPTGTFFIAFENTFNTKLQDVLSPEVNQALQELKKTEKSSSVANEVGRSGKLLESSLCQICHLYSCRVHGKYDVGDSDGCDDSDGNNDSDAGSPRDDPAVYNIFTQSTGLNMSYKSMLARRNERLTRLGAESLGVVNKKQFYEADYPCSDTCFLFYENNDDHLVDDYVLDNDWLNAWTLDDITRLKTWLLTMQHEARAACMLAGWLRKHCLHVYKKLSEFSPPALSSNARMNSQVVKRLDWYDNRRKRIRTQLDWGHNTNTHYHDQRQQPRGCEHVGLSCHEAGTDCSCIKDNILCDKFCGCAVDCYMKFTGCKCAGASSLCGPGCESCPCQLLNRECDPDLCHNCGARELLNPFTKQDRPHNRCSNVAIQQGVGKGLLIGESSHPDNIGYGVYITESVQDGDFISEYTGEIITRVEAGRRGTIYDKFKCSFLFDLNADMSIDAFHYGNKSRFINHGVRSANCEPTVKLVNGEHRIGFYAIKNIRAGTELFFNYGEKFVKEHGLTDKAVRARGLKREVVDHRSSKTDEDKEDEIDEIECEESEEERVVEEQPSRRPRRNVARPLRYRIDPLDYL